MENGQLVLQVLAEIRCTIGASDLQAVLSHFEHNSKLACLVLPQGSSSRQFLRTLSLEEPC